MAFAISDMELTSPAFDPGGPIPRRHTGYGDNVAPPLAWQRVPDSARSLTIVCYDPDAPLVTADGSVGFVHWVVYNIPATVDSLAEGALADTFTTGRNQLGKSEYFGPQPPAGHGRHSYYFWLLALRCDANLPAGLDVRELLTLVEPDVVGMNRLVGTYEQPS